MKTMLLMVSLAHRLFAAALAQAQGLTRGMRSPR
jgi:hypothetical protein